MLRGLVLYASLATVAHAQGIISTFAGTGAMGFGGDNGPAASAVLNRAVYVHIDVAGNIYIADEGNRRVRRIDPATGIITTFAGNGAQGFSGDNGPATAASLNGVNGVCSDPSGNIYLNDTGNNRIRRVDGGGTITTFAGNGTGGTSGDGGPANGAGIFLPIRCAVDLNGVMYITEQGGHRIRRVANGVITTIAGSGARGFAGDGGPSTGAVLDNPTAIAVDYESNVYFSDQSNHRIRRIATNGTISTIAGTGAAGFSGDNGPATAAQLNFPGALAIDQTGNIYFTDGPNQRARRITRDGAIRTFAGTGAAGFSGDGGPASSATINSAFGIAIDSTGAIYLADTFNNRIRKISPLAPGSAPQFTAEAVVNAASFVTGVAQGGLATIFGRNLSPANGIVVTNQSPWPERLNGVGVTIGGSAARVYSLAAIQGQEQISFQVPSPLDVSGGTVNVIVDNNGSRSATVAVLARASQPGIFLIDGANGAFLHANFSLVTAASPASRGEILLLFLTGLGAVNPPVETGNPGPSQEPFASTVVTPTIAIGGQAGDVLFSGLAPGFIGLYQLNFRVPAGAPAGSVDVVVSASGTTSNIAKLQIQ